MNPQIIHDLLNERILILDGGLGTMIQTYNLQEEDYRGRQFTDHTVPLKGFIDLLNITRPDVIREIQYQYLEAGAEIFVTNTFNANAISMEDYGARHYAREINLTASRLSREVADDFIYKHPDRTVFVAGSIGPTNKTASISPDMNDPAFRAISYLDLYQAYYEQIGALVDGGVDIIFFETAFDTLNMKAGLEAAVQVLLDKNRPLPLMLSITLSGKSGRTFSGQTLSAFLASIQHIPLTCVGLNCSFGASDMKPFLKELASIAPCYVCAYPNAGLPNRFGLYDETPESLAVKLKEFIDDGLVNIIGGCCGTTPAHIAQLPALIKGVKPRLPAEKSTSLWLSGLELLEIKPENNFINIGERCNVAGSRLFLRLIKEKKYDEALKIARKQVEDGALIIDVNMDDGLLDVTKEMETFLRLMASDPEIMRVPVMLDSSNWEVIERGLMCLQGKSIVNSISLKEGEDVFLQRANRLRRLGTAIIVMAFDEKGQADSFERKIEVCQRAYQLLTKKIAFPPQDIIFDPNVLAIATGMSEHNRYGLDFIRAVEWIKDNLPYAKVSGGISNLSFAFRGNNYIREAMHAVFLYHAIQAGLDMGIVNPSTTVLYSEIEPSFRSLLEDVVLARRPEAAEELIAYAQEHSEQITGKQEKTQDNGWRKLPLEERIACSLMKGIDDYIETDLQEALLLYKKAVDIINGPLMDGMKKVGDLFGAGKMFLPQIIKTARTMKKAVELLKPAIDNTSSAPIKAGKIVFATVKGDVHDIGKNIVSIVLACNNYEVIDLGVMTPAETILKAVADHQPDLLCLSGLITPSLEEMAHVIREMQKAGFNTPVMVGGATTSKLHTAMKLAPLYESPVMHVADASQNPVIAAQLLNPDTRRSFISELNDEYERLRNSHSTKPLLPLSDARNHRFKTKQTASFKTPIPKHIGVKRLSIPVSEVISYINWRFFFKAWKLDGCYANLSQMQESEGSELPEVETTKAREALKLYKDAQKVLSQYVTDNSCCEALLGFFPAVSVGDDIRIENITFPMLRQQTHSEDGFCLSLSDFISSETDFIGLFAVTAGDRFLAKPENDSYRQILEQSLSDRLVEAAAEYLHEKVRKDYWGYAPDENLSIEELFKARYLGIRPAVGYPSLPDQRLMFKIRQLLPIEDIGIKLTDNGALMPASSVSGFYIAHPEAKYFRVDNWTTNN